MYPKCMYHCEFKKMLNSRAISNIRCRTRITSFSFLFHSFAVDCLRYVLNINFLEHGKIKIRSCQNDSNVHLSHDDDG